MGLQRLPNYSGRFLLPVLLLVLLMPAPGVAQQDSAALPVWGEMFVNAEPEKYLRMLQIAGIVEAYPWSIRGFSLQEAERLAPTDTAHPWSGRYTFGRADRRGLQWRALRPESRLVYNSAFPYGYNDGAVWAGRGVTATLQAGIAARYGPVSLVLAPQVFWTENAEFELMPNGFDGRLIYADGRDPNSIDLPQRFGDEPYTRIHPGQSTFRVDLAGMVVGASTANQHWGPAEEYPLLLGNNAAGFPHVFAGTSTPVDLWIGQAHGRLVWGVLDQSEYAAITGPDRRRFMSGLVGVFVPRGLPGLEIGAARFFHTLWPEQGITGRHFLKPVEGIFKGGLNTGSADNSDVDNQLASVYGRWVFPKSGFEVYGEYGREDHAWDFRDALLEPDHVGAYTMGFHKVWTRSATRFIAMRAEVSNSQVSHLANVRGQNSFYVHSAAGQGHTQLGQILGSSVGYGGAGSTVSADYFYPGGRWTLAWTRNLRQDRSRYASVQDNERSGLDVIQALSAETLLFHKGVDVTAGVGGIYNINRNFAEDVFNFNGSLSVRIGL